MTLCTKIEVLELRTQRQGGGTELPPPAVGHSLSDRAAHNSLMMK